MSNIIINVKEVPYYVGTKVLDGNTYKLTFRWNSYSEVWHLDIVGSSLSILGIALLPGKNLLKPYGYAELGELWVIDNSGANENPTFYDFGSRWTLEYVPLS
jgi:hypothetical protein